MDDVAVSVARPVCMARTICGINRKSSPSIAWIYPRSKYPFDHGRRSRVSPGAALVAFGFRLRHISLRPTSRDSPPAKLGGSASLGPGLATTSVHPRPVRTAKRPIASLCMPNMPKDPRQSWQNAMHSFGKHGMWPFGPLPSACRG